MPAIVMAGLIGGTPALAAASPPAAGLYSSFDYVDAATGSDCQQQAGNYFIGFLRWPGAGRPGAVWRYQINGPGGARVEEVTYPTTPVATSTTWLGAEKSITRPGEVITRSTLDATLTYIDARSFVMEKTVSYGNCTEKVFSSLVAN